MKLNKAHIDGDGNLILQDITSSTVKIEQIPKEIKKFISDLYTWHNTKETRRNTINIIVLATVRERINTSKDFKNMHILDYYGKTPAEWKPFTNDESVFNLLKEYNESSGFKIEAYFIDDIVINNTEFESDLKLEISPRTILIVDGFALHFEKNKKFAKIFDKDTIGGCIIPVCEKHSSEVKSILKKMGEEVLPDISYFCLNKFNRQFINLELHVPTKQDFFRRLTNIAVKHLDIAEPVSKSNWMKKYDNIGISEQNSGF